MVRLLALAAALVSAISLASPMAPAASDAAEPATREVVYYNLGQPEVEPARIFTAFSSSPYVDDLTWRAWGTERAVGTGVYLSECASCAPPRRRTATVVLSDLVVCRARARAPTRGRWCGSAGRTVARPVRRTASRAAARPADGAGVTPAAGRPLRPGRPAGRGPG